MTQSTRQFLKPLQRRDDFDLHDARARFNSRPHDVRNLYVSLKQWRILHAVIDCGGYAEAAKFLHLSQSTISYTVSKMQEQLDVQLLKIEGRRAVLTPEGRSLLDRSRHVLKEAIELETFAKNLGEGWGGEVRLVVDHNCPANLLMQALRKFASLGKNGAQVRLREVEGAQTEEALRNLNADLAISERVPLGYLGEPLVEVEHIAVAHPDHPLLQLGRDLTAADLAQHLQIGIGYINETEKLTAHGAQSVRYWKLNSFDTAITAVCEGLGYAWLPWHRVESLLERNALARLSFGEKPAAKTMLYLIHGRPLSMTPAAGRLVEVLRSLANVSSAAGTKLCPV